MPDLKESLTRYVQEETPSSFPPFSTVRARARHRSHHRAAGLSLVAAMLVVGGTTVTVRHLDKHRVPTSTTAQASSPGLNRTHSQGLGSSRAGAVPLGNATPSCVESYTLQTLAEQAFAFDGTVLSLGAARSDRALGLTDDPGYIGVTFTVTEWFRGGNPPQITVDMLPPSSAPTATSGGEGNSVGGPSYGVGSRLLVSGGPRWGGPPLQNPVAATCGFTRYYQQQTAAAWRQALAGPSR